jgi:hypothetical protein
MKRIRKSKRNHLLLNRKEQLRDSTDPLLVLLRRKGS